MNVSANMNKGVESKPNTETQTVKLPRIMIVGTGSGCGKTTVTCGILGALIRRGMKPASFKCGPDYIDPMFHSSFLGIKSRNLDSFFCNDNVLRYLLAKNSLETHISVIEGVMGMYDGMGSGDICSSNHLSEITETPEILVLSTAGKSLSLLAELHGFLHFKENRIKGIILNHTKASMFGFYKSMIKREFNIPVYGFLPDMEDVYFESRHLGLITAPEVPLLHEKLKRISETCEKNIDIDGIISLAEKAATLCYDEIYIPNLCFSQKIRIAVAKDPAFCFYYQDNLDILEIMGAELLYFSPLQDESLPENISGLILGGGYPEEYGAKLGANVKMRRKIKELILKGIPVIAECGGYMYLCESLRDKHGEKHNMVGVIETEAYMTDRLVRFGYAKLKAERDTLLCKKGDEIKTHEFHYSDTDNNGDAFVATKENGSTWKEIHSSETIFAGYSHIHFGQNLDIPKSFMEKCGKINLVKK